jgi:hypothetical protein
MFAEYGCLDTDGIWGRTAQFCVLSQNAMRLGLAVCAALLIFLLLKCFRLLRVPLRLGSSGLGRLCGEFLGKPKGVHRMFQCPLAEFVSSQVVPLVVCDSGGLMCVNRKVV